MSYVKKQRQATLECGCWVNSRHESTGVLFCNLHQAAPAMREALKHLIHWHDQIGEHDLQIAKGALTLAEQTP